MHPVSPGGRLANCRFSCFHFAFAIVLRLRTHFAQSRAPLAHNSAVCCSCCRFERGWRAVCRCVSVCRLTFRCEARKSVEWRGKKNVFPNLNQFSFIPKLSPTLASVPPPRSVNSRRSTTTTAYRFCDFMLLSLILRLRSSRVEFRILAFHIMKAHKQERWLSTEGSEVMRGFDNVSKRKFALSSFGLFLLTASMKSLPLKVALKGLNRN